MHSPLQLELGYSPVGIYTSLIALAVYLSGESDHALRYQRQNTFIPTASSQKLRTEDKALLGLNIFQYMLSISCLGLLGFHFRDGLVNHSDAGVNEVVEFLVAPTEPSVLHQALARGVAADLMIVIADLIMVCPSRIIAFDLIFTIPIHNLSIPRHGEFTLSGDINGALLSRRWSLSWRLLVNSLTIPIHRCLYQYSSCWVVD